MMQRLSFEVDPALDAQFPARRICRAKLQTKDGRILFSQECEPRGEAHDCVGIDWISNKFQRITAPLLSPAGQDHIISMISSQNDLPIRTIVDVTNTHQYWLVK